MLSIEPATAINIFYVYTCVIIRHSHCSLSVMKQSLITQIEHCISHTSHHMITKIPSVILIIIRSFLRVTHQYHIRWKFGTFSCQNICCYYGHRCETMALTHPGPLSTKIHHKYFDFRYHDDVIKWKHFPRYRLFVRGIHRYAELWCLLWSASE